VHRIFLVLGGAAVAQVILVAASFVGCTSSVIDVPPGTGGSTPDAGHHTMVPFGGGGSWPDGGGYDATYEDPGCPDAGAKPMMFTCDAYHQGNGDCPPGDGCYIYVVYPMDPCAQETYGSMCAKQGPGKQGSGCGGAQDCSGGFTCVVTGSGNQCAALCPLVGPNACTGGTVCEPIDVEGFGGCL
jgi:hypothetical protein